MREEYLWTEKFRPKSIQDIILPPEMIQSFQSMVDHKEIPNLLLCGQPGSGKTTIAKALLEQLECDYLFIPASLRGNIDTLRTEVTQFASSVSFSGKRKYIILDEADYLNYTVQPALRNFMEEYSRNAGFILTCNYKNRIIPAIQSRCSTIEFNFSKDETNKLAAKFFKRVIKILEQENIKFDQKVLATYIQNFSQKGNLDFRKILHELQRYSVSGEIDAGILSTKTETFNELLSFMKAKDFTKVRTWISTEANNDTQTLLREFYDQASVHFTPSFIPELVTILADAQYTSAMVVDQEICLAAALVKVMVSAEWK